MTPRVGQAGADPGGADPSGAGGLGLGAPALALALAFAALALGAPAPVASTPAAVAQIPEPVASNPPPDRLEPVLALRDALDAALREAAEGSNTALRYAEGDPRRLQWSQARREVSIRDDAWFKPGQPELGPEGKRAAADFFPRLASALLSPALREAVGAVLLEAHADPRWGGQTRWTWVSWSRNGELSQKRVQAILTHLGSGPDEAAWRPLLGLLVASSRSWSAAWCGEGPLSPEDMAQPEPCPARTPEDDEQSRRLTVRVALAEAVLLRAAEAR